jgi:hypothetical protein
MLATQRVDKEHGLRQLFGLYQKSCAIDLPIRLSSIHVRSPLRGEVHKMILS